MGASSANAGARQGILVASEVASGTVGGISFADDYSDGRPLQPALGVLATQGRMPGQRSLKIATARGFSFDTAGLGRAA